MKRHTLTILTSLLLLTGSASFAFANESECQIDNDCTGNLICVEFESGGCSASPCEAGKECPEPECESTTYKSCQLPPPTSCNHDTDCTGGTVCVTRTTTTCNGGTASPPCTTENNTDCSANTDPPETTEECTTTTEGLCLPPYLAPCTDNASCGSPGFTCEAVPAQCSCSSPGGSPTIPGDDSTGADADTDPEESECDCPEPDESDRYCKLENVSCENDQQCDNDFICHHFSTSSPDITCSYDAATGEQECDTPTEGNDEPSLGHCAPADYPYWMNGGHDFGNDHSDPTKGEITTEEGGNNDGSGNTGNTGSTGNNPNTTAPNQDSDSNQNNPKDLTNDDPDGCHIASLNTGKTSTTALLLAGAAAFFTARRRRKN